MIDFKRYLFFASIGVLLLISSCRSSRFLEDHQYLVTNNELVGAPDGLDEELEVYIHNEIRPNSRFNLFLYNLVNTTGGRYKTRNIRKIGEPPHILDSALLELSTQQMQRFMFNKGFFNAKVENEVDIRHKKAKIKYLFEPTDPFIIQKVQMEIEDPKVAALFFRNIDSLTQLKPGMRFDADTVSLLREEFHHLMRQNGYFEFIRQYMYVDVDTLQPYPNTTDVKINIQNPPGMPHHIAYRIDSSRVVIRNQQGSDHDTTTLRVRELENGISFADHSGKFRPGAITRHLFLKKGELYNVDLENLGYDLLYGLNSFSRIKIQFTPKDSNRLDVLYDLMPRPRMANQIEGEYTFSSGMGGLNLANIFSHRNLFGGSEQLDLQLRYGILFDSRLEGSLFDRVFNNDFQIGVNITVPRLLAPFGSDDVYQYGMPKTIFTSNLQIFDQDGTYSNRYLVNTVSYQWMQSSKIQHSISPLVLEYRKGILNHQFAQDLIENGYLLYVRSNNRAYFGLGSQYTFTYNASLLTKKEDFTYFRGSLDLSGNVLDLVSGILEFEENESGEKVLFGVPYLQYTKAETDFRYYKNFGGERQFVFRINPGIAVPYGNNSSLLIFEKSFFGGGMNSLRAWQARTLGPGNYNREVLDPSLRPNFRNLDQLGELKLETNLEYRFQLIRNLWGAKIKGATFIDMGNIWRLKENELNPGGMINFSRFFDQIAVGTGAGIRADMGYFIMRLDVGLKVKDPQFESGKQWVIFDLGRAREFRDEYYQSHMPDRYRFFQYNFGIGLPF